MMPSGDLMLVRSCRGGGRLPLIKEEGEEKK